MISIKQLLHHYVSSCKQWNSSVLTPSQCKNHCVALTPSHSGGIILWNRLMAQQMFIHTHIVYKRIHWEVITCSSFCKIFRIITRYTLKISLLHVITVICIKSSTTKKSLEIETEMENITKCIQWEGSVERQYHCSSNVTPPRMAIIWRVC